MQADNLQATVDATGKLVITANNDYRFLDPRVGHGGWCDRRNRHQRVDLVDPLERRSPTLRLRPSAANLVTQYNNIMAQITTTAQDASFNGINLLGGDTLKLTFNETGKSILSITGVNFDAAGLGLANLVPGTDFIDNAATNKVIASLANAAATRCGRKPRLWVRTCRSCRSARTSRRT